MVLTRVSNADMQNEKKPNIKQISRFLLQSGELT